MMRVVLDTNVLVSGLLIPLSLPALVVIPSRRFNAVPQDPPDNEFLDTAVEAKAAVLVSGDAHLLGLESFRGIPILSPARFLALH